MAVRRFTCPFAGCGLRLRPMEVAAHNASCLQVHLEGENAARVASEARLVELERAFAIERASTASRFAALETHFATQTTTATHRGVRAAVGIDVLSTPLLSAVLSFIPLREALRYALVSKAFKDAAYFSLLYESLDADALRGSVAQHPIPVPTLSVFCRRAGHALRLLRARHLALADILVLLRAAPHLARLDIRGNGVLSLADARAVAEACPRLRACDAHVQVALFEIPDTLAALPAAGSVSLTIRHNAQITPDPAVWAAACAAIGRSATVETCFLERCGLNDTACAVLAFALRENTSLQRLHLFNNTFGDVGAFALARALMDYPHAMPRLRLLSVGDGRLPTDAPGAMALRRAAALRENLAITF